MAGKLFLSSPGGGTPGGSNKQVQFNDSGVFGGCAQLFWDKATNRLGIGDSTPARQLSLTKCMELLPTTASDIGVIYKGANQFLHDFQHPVGGGAVPDGLNLFIGKGAGNFTTGSGATLATHGSYNIGVGYKALEGIANGQSNLAFGFYALKNTTSGDYNCAFGKNNLVGNVDGRANIAVGYKSLYYTVSGDYNVGIGNSAGRGVSGQSIYNNTLIGCKAGYLLGTGGNNNIFIGYQAGDNVTSGEKNVIIGYDLNALAAAGDYQLNIASLIFGDLGATKKVGINTSTMNETLNVGGAIRLGTSALANTGTIRWNGTNFQGYKGGAWVNLDSASGTPGGSDTQVQFNDSGNFGGAAQLFWDKANDRLGIGDNAPAEKLEVAGAIRMGTTALANTGTIRWNGTNFQGYKGGAWVNLDSSGSLWTDAGQYIRPSANANYRVLDTGTDLSTVTFSANTVFVLTPGSTYSIGSTLTISNDYVTVLGHGAKILKTAHCMLKLSGNHCKLIGFEIDGGSHGYDNVYVTGSYNEISGITSHHATHVSHIGIGIALTKEGTPTPSAKYNVVTNCVCHDNHMGIANWKGMYNTISNNYTYNSAADGYTCDGDAGTGEYAYGNIYIGNRSYNDANGIGVDSAHYCTFTGNHIKGTTTYGGITTWNIEGPCSYCTFVGNTLENNHLYGICLGDGAGGTTTHCKLSGNVYHNNGSGDWYVDPDCDYNVIMEDDIYVRNNKGLFHRNAANTAWLQTLITDAWDGVTLGKAASVVVLGTDSVTANPVAIRVNGVNTKYITVGAVDSGGAGYRLLRVTN